MKLIALKSLVLGLVTVSVTNFAPARANEESRCTKAPRSEWKSVSQATAALRAGGYRVDSIDRDARCFEAVVRDRSGQMFEIYVDPVTLRFVKIERVS